MRVKNRKCIRRLSFKSLWASRKRNMIELFLENLSNQEDQKINSNNGFLTR